MATLRNRCTAAPPDPCRNTNYPRFQAGIATRVIPPCAADSQTQCCLPDGCAPGAAAWRVLRDGSLDRTRWIEGWIVNQLGTRGRIECDEHSLGKRDGGWWADSFRSDGFKSGSKLWSLRWSRTTNETLLTAKRYAEEALAWLIGWGIAKSITVVPSYVCKSVLRLDITVAGPGVAVATTVEGLQMPSFDWLWQPYRQDSLSKVGA